MDNPKHSATADRIKEEVGDMAEDAREKLETKARTEAETMRDTAAKQAEQAANAADAAAAEFDPSSLQARAIEQLATRIEDIARDIRGADIDRMARTVRTTAQRNPLMFVAGAALAGFALTRFLGARQETPSRNRTAEPDPWAPPAPAYGDHERNHDLTSRGGV